MGTAQKKIEQFFTEAFNFIVMQEELDLKARGIEDLTMVEIHVLEAVQKSSTTQDATMKEVADFLHISKGSLTVSSNRLITKGYLNKVTDEFDRRKKYLKLTEKGQNVCEIHEKWHEELTKNTLEGMEKEQVDVLTKALDNVVKFLYSNE